MKNILVFFNFYLYIFKIELNIFIFVFKGINYGSGDKSRMNRVQSPVSNQLARWFSPELLAQARAGRLPNMPAMSQNVNMLSVEDIEKFQVGGRS